MINKMLTDCTHPDSWFSRTTCGLCGDMHYYCTECGKNLDYCDG